MACRTVLDTLFHALVRYAAPVLVFSTEEVWGRGFQRGGACICSSGPCSPTSFVTPAKAGAQPTSPPQRKASWIPAFAGMTS